MRFLTQAGSEIDAKSSGAFSASWDWIEEKDCCIDARPIAVEHDGERLLVTVRCDCHSEEVVIAHKEPE